jgi:hypothetical protein
MIERFRKEFDRALSHGLNPHPGISMGGSKDDRDIASFYRSIRTVRNYPAS